MKNYRKFILIILLLGMFYVLKGIYKEDNIRLVEENNWDVSNINNFQNISQINANSLDTLNTLTKDNYFNEKNIINYKKIVNENSIDIIPDKYFGFEVDCVLKIPKINLETYVFKEYSKTAMDICVTKLWGPNPNEFGNYSIIGHNYQKENMFNNLIELKIGDPIYLTDNINGKYKYVIYDIYKVKENNVTPINQTNKKDREITLITCVNYTNNRLIVKAREE